MGARGSEVAPSVGSSDARPCRRAGQNRRIRGLRMSLLRESVWRNRDCREYDLQGQGAAHLEKLSARRSSMGRAGGDSGAMCVAAESAGLLDVRTEFLS